MLVNSAKEQLERNEEHVNARSCDLDAVFVDCQRFGWNFNKFINRQF